MDSLYKIGGIRASGVAFDPTDTDLLSDVVVMAASMSFEPHLLKLLLLELEDEEDELEDELEEEDELSSESSSAPAATIACILIDSFSQSDISNTTVNNVAVRVSPVTTANANPCRSILSQTDIITPMGTVTNNELTAAIEVARWYLF